MVNNRLLFLTSLFMIGSCAPLTPSSTSINIYTNTDGKVVERRLTPDRGEICRSIDEDLLKRYELPALPNLEGIPRGPDQEKQIMDALVAHIKVLRADIRKMQQAANCGQRIPGR